MKLVHWPLMGGLLHLLLFAVPNVKVHPSTASVPITIAQRLECEVLPLT